MTEGKRQGKSRKRNILDDTFGRNSFTLLLGPVVVVGRGDHSLGFAVRAMHSRSLSRFEPGLGKFEVAWEVGWNCCEVVTRMSPTNTGDRWVGIGKILFFFLATLDPRRI